MTQVSVVIPTYARPRDLEVCLEALARQTAAPLEVIVVDDGSPEPYAPQLAERFAFVRALRQEQEGPARARYRGAQAARGEIIALCDDDVVPPPDWLEQAVRCLQASGAPGVEGATSPPPDIRPDHARVQHNTGGSFLTCNLLLRRDAFLACPPDPRFRRPFREDSDLALSIQERFGRIVFCPEARMVHPTSRLAFGKLLRTAWWHYYDGLVVRRHGHGTDGIGVLRVGIAGRTVTVLRPKQRLALAQAVSLAACVAAPTRPARRAALAATAATTLAQTAYEQRYWVRAALEHDPGRLRSPEFLGAAVRQGAEQAVANVVRGVAYAAGRIRWSFAPREARALPGGERPA